MDIIPSSTTSFEQFVVDYIKDLKISGLSELAKVLERIDRSLASQRPKYLRIIKLKPRSILTSIGMLSFKRRYYYDEINHCYLYLLDAFLAIPKRNKLMYDVKIKLIEAASEMSYAKAGCYGSSEDYPVSKSTVYRLIRDSEYIIEDRYALLNNEAAIHDGKNISEISRMLSVNKSTISRELNRRMTRGMFCSTIKIIATCNVCRKKNYCNFHPKLYYDYKVSDNKAQDLRMTLRRKSRLSKGVIKEIDEIVTPLIMRGQSLHHIYVSDINLQMLCSERTLRRLIYRRELSVSPSSLRRYVRFPHHLPKKEKSLVIRDIRYIIGRKYSDYLNYVKAHQGISRVEYDSVIGKINDFQAILTITFVKYDFQFGLLIKKGDSSSVLEVLKGLYKKVGEKAKDIFEANLCDNGTEFAQFYEIERYAGPSFYATPYRSNDKPHCERAHEFVRYVFPKGKSLNKVSQEMLDEVFSNINSYVRKSKGDKAPYDLVRAKFGKPFLDVINIQRIDNKKVKLTQLI